MKRQGKRTDLTCAPLEHKSDGQKARDVVAEKNGDSREQVRRYVRLTELIQPLLEMVDEKRIAFRPAVELSYLPKELQAELFDVIAAEECLVLPAWWDKGKEEYGCGYTVAWKCMKERRVSTYGFYSYRTEIIYRIFALNAYQAQYYVSR